MARREEGKPRGNAEDAERARAPRKGAAEDAESMTCMSAMILGLVQKSGYASFASAAYCMEDCIWCSAPALTNT